ncbi:MAG: 3,4-dihydroxy-2-butanone-4-phosphate synthase [Bdellovibrionales bacterium]|nr:3,4-dihydroxy-2-butanone-4-phosphate synthase [Bdellovibrionales bacterium]
MNTRLETAVSALKRGEMVILVDSEDRENEGDLILAAEFATPEKINFMIRKACGLVCLSLEAEQVDRLGLPLMVPNNESPRKTAFTVSIEAATGVTTGISAADRARTIQVASDPSSSRLDLVAPGHIFPLRAAPGGVLERAGHTEGSLELCRLAGLRPAAVICEIINEDGSMARRPDLEEFSRIHSIPILTIEDLIEHQALNRDWLKESSIARFPNRFGGAVGHEWKIQCFRNPFTGAEHALMFTDSFLDPMNRAPLVRIHSECLTGDALGSLRCDCGNQLSRSLSRIGDSPSGGAVIYLKNHEGRGIGLFNKIEAYALQDSGQDTLDANVTLGFKPDERHYQDAAKILHKKGVKSIRLLTNNPHKVRELQTFGIQIEDQVGIEGEVNEDNLNYLKTKRERFHHQLGNL